MRTQYQLLHARTRVRPRYALMPLEGYPTSRIPGWENAEVRVLASPALGAGFVEYCIDLQPGGGTTVGYGDAASQTFVYVVSGAAKLSINNAHTREFTDGAFALIPNRATFLLRADLPTRLLMLRKRYEPLGSQTSPRIVLGHADEISRDVYCGDPGARLQVLIPDEPDFDMAMNIFTFEPGHSLPVVETHVMEHGLFVLQGKGVYYLDNEWMEVERDDFIWMGPFCPQSYYATGPVASKYIYYKNVNRDIAPS